MLLRLYSYNIMYVHTKIKCYFLLFGFLLFLVALALFSSCIIILTPSIDFLRSRNSSIALRHNDASGVNCGSKRRNLIASFKYFSASSKCV